MFDASSIIVGLEIGTSKVCAVVGEQSAGGSLNIIGLGQARSRGVRKGEIVDTTQAEEDVRNAIVEAEQMADVEIRNVYLGVTGGTVVSIQRTGTLLETAKSSVTMILFMLCPKSYTLRQRRNCWSGLSRPKVIILPCPVVATMTPGDETSMRRKSTNPDIGEWSNAAINFNAACTWGDSTR